MPKPTLLTISGSLRKGSFNRMLLHEAVETFGSAHVIETDLDLPLYNGDDEDAHGLPDKVRTLVKQIEAADAVVIATPEYNKGITGVLKNALDWISRAEGMVLRGKPTVVISANAGRTGGETGQFMTISCLVQLQARLLFGPPVLVAAAQDQFDETGRLTTKSYITALETRMQALRAEVV